MRKSRSFMPTRSFPKLWVWLDFTVPLSSWWHSSNAIPLTLRRSFRLRAPSPSRSILILDRAAADRRQLAVEWEPGSGSSLALSTTTQHFQLSISGPSVDIFKVDP